ncbi:MAG: ABC transporter substrate-binding protein [Phycisphaerae bacterium]
MDSAVSPLIGLFLLILAPLALPAGLRAAEPPRAEAVPRYGRTPDAVIPFRSFHEPYTRFFQRVMEFRGARPAETPVDTSEKVRIGFFGPLEDAPDADLGQQMLEGVRLAVEQSNAAGGYHGTSFELVIRPDTGLWGSSSNEMVAMRYEDDVLGVIGSVDGANTHIALRAALKIKMPMVNTATTDPTLTETNVPWLIRCMADDRQQGYALAYHIFKECGLTNVAALRVNDRFGRTGIAEFRDAARRLRHPLRVELRWEPGDRDFTTQLERIAAADCEAIVLWGNASDAAAVVREIRRRKMPVRVFGCDRLASRAFLEQAGEAADGVVAVGTNDPTPDDARTRAFAKAYRARFGHDADAFAAHAYDGANILIGAIRQAGPNRIAIRDALFDLRHYDGVTGPIEFDTTLNDVGPVYIVTVHGDDVLYRQATFTSTARAPGQPSFDRALVQSPPRARSAARDAELPRGPFRVGCYVPHDRAGLDAVRGIRLALGDDRTRHKDQPAIELVVRDIQGNWGDDTAALAQLAMDRQMLAIIGSTERRGTHLAEMLAAKFHFPVVTLCDSDVTITKIPLPWIFCIAPAGLPTAASFGRRFQERYGLEAGPFAVLGYDAGSLLADQIRAGAHGRLALRNKLAASGWRQGVSGTFRFDALGNRMDRVQEGATGGAGPSARISLGRRKELGGKR